jgi:hypothetical protein
VFEHQAIQCVYQRTHLPLDSARLSPDMMQGIDRSRKGPSLTLTVGVLDAFDGSNVDTAVDATYPLGMPPFG